MKFATNQIELEAKSFNFFYNGGSFKALTDVNVKIPRHKVTAFIGPSGCGKSTFLRSINRMNDEIPGTKVEGELLLQGADVYTHKDLTSLRKQIGMIFQQPTPFPISIFDNVAYGMRLESHQIPKSEIEGRVEEALRGAALWDEVKNMLKRSGMALSGGQQQRLCIARAIAVRPDIVLMDEPCAALDPIATLKIEELIKDLSESYTIVIVTHNMQQAARVSDYTAFFTVNDQRSGMLVEFDETKRIFTNPADKRTEDYIMGRFG